MLLSIMIRVTRNDIDKRRENESKGAVTLSPTRQHDTTFTQYLVCDGPISYYVRGCVEHSAHKVSYWPITDQTLRKCRVVMSCRMQCESSLRVGKDRKEKRGPNILSISKRTKKQEVIISLV